MREKPLISVIIPIYNIEDCLERCVKSVQAQTMPELEILLVDDGSTDGSGALCDRLAAQDGRIRAFHQQNGGSSSARNRGIREARGDYLGFVDSDDWIEPGMYEKLLDAAGRLGVSIVSVSRDEIDDQGCRRPDVCVPPGRETVSRPQEFLRELLLHRGDCSFCTKLIRRELFTGKAFPEGKLNEDFYLLVQMLAEGEPVATLPDQMYHVFYRLDSNTRKKNRRTFSRVFIDIVENADFVLGLVEASYPELREEAVRFGLRQRLDYLLHIPVERMKNSDPFYRGVKAWLRKHWKDTLFNPYLGRKDRLYLALLTLAPRTVRSVHGWKMAASEGRKRGKGEGYDGKMGCL